MNTPRTEKETWTTFAGAFKCTGANCDLEGRGEYVPTTFARELESELIQCVTALKAVANRKTIGDEFDARKLVAAALRNTKSAAESANGALCDGDEPPQTLKSKQS